MSNQWFFTESRAVASAVVGRISYLFFYTLKAGTTTTRNKKCYWGLFYFGFNEKSRKKCSSQLTLHLLKEKVYLVKQWILNSGKILFCKKKECLKDAGASFAWFSAVRQTFTIHTSNTEEFYRQWQCSNQLLLHANIKLLL